MQRIQYYNVFWNFGKVSVREKKKILRYDGSSPIYTVNIVGPNFKGDSRQFPTSLIIRNMYYNVGFTVAKVDPSLFWVRLIISNRRTSDGESNA